MKCLGVVSVALLTCTAARAQSPTNFSAIEAKLNACETAHVDPDGSAHCQIAAFSAADQRLNQVYGSIVAYFKKPGADQTVNGEIVTRLVAAERAWVVFRDAQCNYMSTVALHAPLEGYEYHACRYELTKERIKTLTAPDAPQNQR